MGVDVPEEDVKKDKGVYGSHVYHNMLNRAGERLQGRFTYFFGSRGQTVYMMPQEKLVAVRFGQQIPKLHSTLYAIDHSISGP
jgi:hypothetical protein